MTGPPADDPPPPAGWLAGAVVLGLFATLAFSVRSVLGPFILYALFLYVVWPWIGRPVVSRLAVGATALGMVALRQIQFGKGMFLGEKLTTGVTVFFPTVLFAAGMIVLGRKTLSGILEQPLLDWFSLAVTIVLSYFWIQFQMRLIQDWIYRMKNSGMYWSQVGEIPPSGRVSSHTREK